MKRLLFTLALILVAGNLWAAGTCVESGDNPTYIYSDNQKAGDEILLLCTHHTDNSLSVALSATVMSKLSGWYSWQIVSFPGDTAPTDNTDLEITEQMTATIGLSLLGTNGTDFIDATIAKETLFYNSFLGIPTYRMAVTGRPWTISTTNNAVASATFYLLLRRVP
jgi:hypothetical protein